MTSAIEARRATEADAELVTSIVSAAFATDPLWGHAFARPGGGTDHHARFWRVFVAGALRYPWVWVTTGGEAASVWIPPDGDEMSEEQEGEVIGLAHELLGRGAADYVELLERFDEAHPRDEPHYYLSLLATHPDHRGRGIGMALLRANLDVIDAEGMPAYLESSNPANNHRYAGVGFEAVGEFSYPGGSPVVTTMWRAAR
ncbi:MAG TPA: GNAT family N-acetyltransferase [Acidimicrobiales bacterium]|nr:GNAT family N-acetyltransferase [Acidimicrobiales bacterium]